MIAKLLRRFLKLLSGLVLALVLICGTSYVLLQLGPVNEAILTYVKNQFEISTGWKLNAKTIDRISPFSLRLRQVELTCPGSATIKADRISLTFAPHHLMLGQILFPSVSVRDVTIAPMDEVATVCLPPTIPSIPRFLPLGFEIRKLKITNLQLPESWREHRQLPSSLNVAAQLQASALHQTALIDLSFEDNVHRGAPTVLMLSAHIVHNMLSVDMRLAEDSHGLLHKTAGALPSYSIEFYATTTTELLKPLRELTLREIQLKAHSAGLFSIHCTLSDDEDEELNQSSLFAEFATLEGEYEWIGGESLKLTHIKILSERGTHALNLLAEMDLHPDLELHQIEFTASLNNLQAISDHIETPLSGSVSATGTLKGPWSNPGFDVDIQTSNLAVSERLLGDVRLQGDGTFSRESIDGSLALVGSIGDVATSASFDLHWDYGPKAILQDIHWRSPTAALKGNLEVWLSSYLVDGRLEGETGDLAWLVPERYGKVHGLGWLTLDLRSQPDMDYQDVTMNFEVEGLALPHLWSDRLQLSAKLQNIFNKPFGSVSLVARDLRSGDARLKDLTIETDIPNGDTPWNYTIQANGRWESKFRLKASGNIDPTGPTVFASIDNLSGRLQGHSLLLTNPAIFSWSTDSAQINSFNLKIGTGQLSFGGSYGEEADLSLKVYKMPIEIAQLFISHVPSQGFFSGEFFAKGPPSHPEASFSVSVDGLVVVGTGLLKVPPLRGHAEGSLTNDLLQVKGDIVGIGAKPVSVAVRLPLLFSLVPMTAQIIPDQPLWAKIDAAGEFSPLLQLLFSDTNSVTGQARVAIDVSGTYQSPLVNGTLDLRDSTYEVLDTGSLFKNIQAKFEARGNQIVLTGLTAQDDSHGTVTGQGVVHLNLKEHCPFEITFNINNALVLHRDYVQATASGQLQLVGNFEDIELRGNLTVDRMAVTVPKQLPAPAASLDITFINSPRHDQAAKQLDPKNNHPLQFNVVLDVPGNAFLTTEDLSSEWRGSVVISGNSSAPLYNGELRISRGSYWLNGKTFDLDKGTVTFAGDFEKRTYLYVVAQQDIDRYTIEAVLKGPLKDPELTLRSNPHMSQREILSWIIFNRGLNDVTPLESDQAGQAVVDLSNGYSSNTSTMMSRLRRLGIDRIDFGAADEDDPDSHDLAVNIGKYLFRDVYISLNRGITTETNRVKLEANVVRYVKFQAEVDDEASGGVSLMWKRDY